MIGADAHVDKTFSLEHFAGAGGFIVEIDVCPDAQVHE